MTPTGPPGTTSRRKSSSEEGKAITRPVCALAALLACGFLSRGVLAAGAPSPTEGFEGRVAHEGQVRAGVRVFIYRTFDDLTACKPLAVSPPSGDNGQFEIAVGPGSWWLAAKLRAAGSGDGPLAVGDLFAYQGSNPINVAPGRLTHVGFSLVKKELEVVTEEISPAEGGAVAGVVTYQGQPLAGVPVSLFLDASENFRGLAYATAPPTGKSGAFRLDLLPENRYYLVARKRASGAQAGPITDGDFFGYFIENPVRVQSVRLTRVVFELGSKAGEIGKEDSLFRESGTRVSGRITDGQGRPVAGVYAFAYLEKSMIHRRPAFISRETGGDGAYILFLSQGGTYYLGARSGYGEGPSSGEWYGRYEGSADHSLTLATGESLGEIDITVKPVVP